MAIEDILSKLDPKTRGRVMDATSVNVEKQKTASIGLNMALGGGLGFGRQVLLWGNKSASKSSFCLQTIALAQKEGRTCAWIDAEASYDQGWAERLGVDSSQLLYSPAKTINEMVDVGVNLMDAGADIIVVDSISALLPAIYFEKDSTELKKLEDTKQIGAEAKDMTHAVKMLNYANKNTLLILISQQRNQFGSMHASHIPTGGMAVKFFSSTVIKLWSSEAEANAIKAGVQVGDKIIERKVGRPVNWIIDYNKLGPPNLSGQYDFYYQGDRVGIDVTGEVLDVAEQMGVVEKGGAWYTVLGERFQGRAKTIEWLRENPESVDELRNQIYAKNR